MHATAPAISPEPPVAQKAQVSDASCMPLRLVEARKLTVRQAARAAGVSEAMMRLEIQNGKIPVIRIGSKMMVLEGDLEAYLRGNYGVVKQATMPVKFSRRLPKHIIESEFLYPKAKSA